jgi:tRNA pseudouridine55 synthase
MNFEEGEVILINKPLGWTSFDVVKKLGILIRKHLSKSVKVGHAGTLDPLATGLLIICTGKMTKRADEVQLLEKEYTGTLTLGSTTPSFDRETKVNATFPVGHISADMVREAAEKFIGTSLQVPPAYSAKKVDGKRAYRLARKGKEARMYPSEIRIGAFDITGTDLPDVHFRIVCSKGTYIRSVAHDLGRAMNSGAYLSALCRTRIGTYRLKDAVSIEDFGQRLSRVRV